jgi:alpha-1,2-mannosyltransferase
VFFLCAVAFGVNVEVRSDFLNTRRTDFDVYLRAAWAMRTGHDPYTITDNRGWHYLYPPLFAIALIPLADPPPGQSRAGMMPFGVAVAIWYVLNLILVGWAVNHLAAAMERAVAARYGGIPPPGSRSWWALRILPMVICLPPIGVALERGQADLLLLAMLVGFIVAVMARRSLAAGMWLAAAICLKVIPLYLLIYPLWRRDWRMIAACALGVVIGIGIIPAALLGPAKAIRYTREWNHVLIAPAMFAGKDRSRARELLDINATDNQSFVALIHRWRNFDETLTIARRLRSRPLEPWAKPAHWCIAIVLTALTLLAASGRRAAAAPIHEELLVSCLMVLMVLSSPVSHLHYFSLLVPLAMGLMVAGRGAGVYPGRKWAWLFAAVIASGALPLLPGLGALRDLGMASFGALALWSAGLLTMRRSAAEISVADHLDPGALKAPTGIGVGQQP